MKIEYDMEKWYRLEKQKSLSMSLARESYAKKIRTTPRIKTYIPSSSNLARNINVLKIGRRIFLLTKRFVRTSSEGGYFEENWYYRKSGLVIGVT